MTRLIAYRLILSIPLLFLVSILTFVLEAIVPGNAVDAILGSNFTHQEYEHLYIVLGLNHPLWYQYVHWLGGVLHGNLGTSITTGQPVTSMLDQCLPVTLALVGGVLVICGTLGPLLGVLSSLREGKLGRLLDAFSMVGISLPAFWLALMLISIFAVRIKIFPAAGFTYFSASPAGWIRGLILPIISLSLGGVTIVAKQTRAGMREALDQPFVRGLRAAGVSERAIIWRHALRNAAAPAVTILGVVMIGALSGSVFVESVFVLPGLGSTAVTATGQHDLPVIEGVAMYFTLITIAINLGVDVTYGWLNPKLRIS
jgi:peptide/nickel transport system permease protein